MMQHLQPATRGLDPQKMTETRSAIRRARELLGDGRPDRAGELLRDVLDKQPDNTEARYTLAVAQRHRQRWSEALATLEQVLAARPGYGRAHQEVGYNLLGSQNYKGAAAAFERAVAADPSLINSWKCLARLYGGRTDHARLKPVLDQIEFLEGLPPELLTVISYLSESRLDDAERLCRQFLRANKTHIEGMRLLAEIATRNGVYGEAEFLLESCIEFEPGHRNARNPVRQPAAAGAEVRPGTRTGRNPARRAGPRPCRGALAPRHRLQRRGQERRGHRKL